MARRSRPRVVIVEDDYGFFESIRMNLRLAGWKCIWYSYASSDLEEIIDIKPAAVLVDVHLSAGNGIDLAQRLKQCGCTFPIIMMTGDINAAAEIRQNHPDITHVLEKPFSSRHLGGFLNELAERP